MNEELSRQITEAAEAYAESARPCPRCGIRQEIRTRSALSRYDNKTYICSDCGTAEALFNFMYPNMPLPSPDTKIML